MRTRHTVSANAIKVKLDCTGEEGSDVSDVIEKDWKGPSDTKWYSKGA